MYSSRKATIFFLFLFSCTYLYTKSYCGSEVLSTCNTSINTTDDNYDDVMMVMVICGSLFIFFWAKVPFWVPFRELYMVVEADGFDPGLMWTDPGKSANAALSTSHLCISR